MSASVHLYRISCPEIDLENGMEETIDGGEYVEADDVFGDVGTMANDGSEYDILVIFTDN